MAAFVDWIAPLPTALMVTVAPEPVYGLKGYGGLLADVVQEAATLGRVLDGQVGALAFTQDNARGGLHLHALVWGPDELRELRRVALARTLEQRWRSEWHAQWVGEQKVRVSVVPCTDRAGMHRYAVRYASRDTDGNMIEAGAPMERWVKPALSAGGGGMNLSPGQALKSCDGRRVERLPQRRSSGGGSCSSTSRWLAL